MIDAEGPLLGVGILPVGAVGGAEVVLTVVFAAAARGCSGKDGGPLVADGMRGGVIGIDVCGRGGLQGSGERVEVGTEQGDVVDAIAAADCGLVVVEGPEGESEARHEAKLGIVLEAAGESGLACGLDGHAGSTVDDGGVGVVEVHRGCRRWRWPDSSAPAGWTCRRDR